MLDKYELELIEIGEKKLLDFVKKEFPDKFSIIARTDEMFVLGDSIKNVKFSRDKFKVLERYVFPESQKLSRK
jgi:predicted esterase YcpF (UPF0227 family)